MLDNREIALIIWLIVLLVWSLSDPKLRSSLARVARSAAARPVAITALSLVAWTALACWATAGLLDWNWRLVKVAAIWLFASGLVLLFKFDEAHKQRNYFGRKLRGIIGASALAEFYLNSYSLPLPLELLMQPILLVLTFASAPHRDRQPPGCKPKADAALAIIAMALIAYVAIRTAQDWSGALKSDLVAQFALPAWLTAAALPLVYGLAIIAAHDATWGRLAYQTNQGATRRMHHLLGLFIGFRLDAHGAASLSGRWLRRYAATETLTDAVRVARACARAARRASAAADRRKRRLRECAGVEGSDGDGRQLDQREFEATKRSLQWVATCMLGHYKDDTGFARYLGEQLHGSFEAYGIGEPSGIVIEVAQNGRKWLAKRRTITGWWFAIGQSSKEAHPASEWVRGG